MRFWKQWQDWRRWRAAVTRCPPDWGLWRDDHIIFFRHVLLWCSLHLRSEGGRRQTNICFSNISFIHGYQISAWHQGEGGKKVAKLHFNSRQQHRLICIIEQSSVKVSAFEVVFFIMLVQDAGLWWHVGDQWEKKNSLTLISQIIHCFTNHSDVRKKSSQTNTVSQYLNSFNHLWEWKQEFLLQRLSTKKCWTKKKTLYKLNK